MSDDAIAGAVSSDYETMRSSAQILADVASRRLKLAQALLSAVALSRGQTA